MNYTHGDPAILTTPGMQPLLARLGAACELVAADFDRIDHVKRIALDVLAARARPRCPQPHTEEPS